MFGHQLVEFENVPTGRQIYKSIEELLEQQPSLQQQSATVYLINFRYGFGSALTVFMQNLYYLQGINPLLTVLPQFAENSSHFKYHEPSLNNSFFLYFERKRATTLDGPIYFCRSKPIARFAFFTASIPPMQAEPNRRFIENFQKDYALRLDTTTVDHQLAQLRATGLALLGVHIRSYAQKIRHCSSYAKVPIQQRLENLKTKLDRLYDRYCVFVATDVTAYLYLAQAVFTHTSCLDSIKRVAQSVDSVPALDEHAGFCLGSEILYDCYALSQCDKIYGSPSNVLCIINTLNANAVIEEY